MTEQCTATIQFSDDYGDNSTTFHCQLEDGHAGLHREAGDMGYGQEHIPYTLQWDGDSGKEE